MKKPAKQQRTEFIIEQPTSLTTDTALLLSAAGVYDIDMAALDSMLHSGVKAQTLIDQAANYSGMSFEQLKQSGEHDTSQSRPDY